MLNTLDVLYFDREIDGVFPTCYYVGYVQVANVDGDHDWRVFKKFNTRRSILSAKWR